MRWGSLLIAVGVALVGLCGAARAEPSPALGLWANPKQGWVIETLPCESGICGRLVSFLKGNLPDYVARDSQNPDKSKRATPLCGMMLIGGFKPAAGSDHKWEHGWVYDPDTGSTYSGEAEITNGNEINVRGYVLIPLLGSTITLVRQTDEIQRCAVPSKN